MFVMIAEYQLQLLSMMTMCIVFGNINEKLYVLTYSMHFPID